MSNQERQEAIRSIRARLQTLIDNNKPLDRTGVRDLLALLKEQDEETHG